MWIVLTTTLLLAAGPEVSVTTLAGDQARGKLVRLDSDGAALATSEGQRAWPSTDLLSLRPVSVPQALDDEKASVWLELIDGSQLLATEVTVTKGVARATLVGGESVDIPTRSLHSLRLQEHDSEFAKASQLARQWQEIVSGEPAGDVIVIRKVTADDDTGGPAEAILDQLEGVLGDITDVKVHFTYDDQSIPVDRGKVEGVIYFHPAGRELPVPLCRVDDVAGSRWNAKSITVAGEIVQLVSTSGVKCELPLARVAGFDYSAGKIVYLSDLEPETVEWSSAFAKAAAGAHLERMFRLRRDESFTGEPLMVAGKSYEKGLAVHSRTLLEYRLQGKYSKFLALAAIDDRVRPAGDLRLVVSLDGKQLAEHRIRGKDEAPLPLEFDIRGGRKLSLLVDFGEGLDVADRLHLVNARVTK